MIIHCVMMMIVCAACVSHIPKEIDINNSDADSMSIDGNQKCDDEEEDHGQYHTNNGIDQKELSKGDNTETNEDKNEENGSDGDGRNTDDDKWMCRTEK